MENLVYIVHDDIEADNLVGEIRELQAEKNRFDMIYKAKKEQLDQDYIRQTESLNKQMEFDKAMLQAYFTKVPAKETKTLRKYKLLSGELVMKKASTKLAHDDSKILEHLQAEGNEEYIKSTPKLDWTKFRENLLVNDDGTIVTKDGEVLEIEGLKMEVVPESFEIKL